MLNVQTASGYTQLMGVFSIQGDSSPTMKDRQIIIYRANYTKNQQVPYLNTPYFNNNPDITDQVTNTQSL